MYVSTYMHVLDAEYVTHHGDELLKNHDEQMVSSAKEKRDAGSFYILLCGPPVNPSTSSLQRDAPFDATVTGYINLITIYGNALSVRLPAVGAGRVAVKENATPHRCGEIFIIVCSIIHPC